MLKKYIPGRNAVDVVVSGSHIYGNLEAAHASIESLPIAANNVELFGGGCSPLPTPHNNIACHN